MKEVFFKMKKVLKFIAIHTLFWIAVESLYTRGKIHFVKKKNIRKLEKKSQKTRTLHRKLYYCLRSSLQKVGLRLNLFKLNSISLFIIRCFKDFTLQQKTDLLLNLSIKNYFQFAMRDSNRFWIRVSTLVTQQNSTQTLWRLVAHSTRQLGESVNYF